MIADLKPYSAYKGSGVPWLGEVPKHWTTERLKTSMNNIVEQTTERLGADLYVAMEHVESWTGRLRHAGHDVSFDSQVKHFQSGDVLFGKLRPYLAKVTPAYPVVSADPNMLRLANIIRDVPSALNPSIGSWRLSRTEAE